MHKHTNTRTHTHTHIYIYCYCYSQTGEMFQAEIETRLTLRQSGILPQSYRPSQFKWRDFYVYIYLHTRLSATGVVNSREMLCIYIYVAATNSILECSTLGRSIWIVIYRQTVSLYHNFSVWCDTYIFIRIYIVIHRYVRCFKLGSKPGWHYFSRIYIYIYMIWHK